MSQVQFHLTQVEVLTGCRLRLTYADAQTWEVDLTDWIDTTEGLRPLKDAVLFAQARPGFGGLTVDWIRDELDLGADNLRNLAIEQAGGIGHERLWNWLYDTGLSLEEAARALGLSRRTLSAYRNGVRPIPRAVWLACLGWQAVRPQGPALPKHIPSVSEYAALHI